MRKRTMTIMMAVCVTAAISGCGQGKQPNNNAAQPSTVTQPTASPASPSPSATPAALEKSIQAYYADDTASKLVARAVTIRYAEEKAKYAEAFKALQTSPDKQLVALFDGIALKSAAEKDGALVLDVSIKPEGRLGSGGEALLLQALKQTMFQFAELKTIDVLVDGKQVESLMGHMDLPHPMKR